MIFKPLDAAPRSGDRVGSYVLVRELGRGGMGVVFEARHVEVERRVALKLLLVERSTPDRVARFAQEGAALAKLRHANVVTVHELGTHAGRPFLVMDLVEGESLQDMIEQHPLDPAQTARIVEQLARAVAYAHDQGILHRDIKPANVLLTADDRPLLVDFGLARDLCAARERLTSSGEVLGTPAYMAPEQATGELDRIDSRTDVYGLGATLYAALTGRPPFVGHSLVNVLAAVLGEEPDSPRSIRPELDPELEAVCLRCLEKQPQERYGSAAELADGLARALRGEPVQARRSRSARRAWRWLRRRGALLGLAGGLLLLATALALNAPDASPLARSLAALRDEHPAKRIEAARALAALGPQAIGAGDELQRLVQSDTDATVRAAAAEALGGIGDQRALGLLERTLGDASDPAVRAATAGALARLGERGVAALIAALADDARRGPAADALVAASEPPVAALLEALQRRDPLEVHLETSQGREPLEAHLAEVLVRVGAPAIPAVARAYEAEPQRYFPAEFDPSVAGQPIPSPLEGILSGIGEPAVPALANMVRDPNGRRREEAARILGELGPRAADGASALVEVLGSQDSVAKEAARALGRIGDGAVPHLVRSLDDPKPAIRRACAERLSAHGERGRPAVPHLIVMLRDSNAELRRSAVACLRSLGRVAAAAVPALKRALGDGDPQVREQAVGAVDACAPDNEAIAAIVPLLDDRDPKVRSSVVLVLGDAGECRPLPELVARLDDPDLDVQLMTVAALFQLSASNPWAETAVFEAIEHRNPNAQWFVISGLTGLGAAAAPGLPAVVRVAREGESLRARKAALNVLADLDPGVAVPLLLEVLEDVRLRQAVADLLGKLQPGTQAVRSALAAMLQDGEPEGRAAACFALGKNGPGFVVPVLSTALRDGEPKVRKAAAWALGETDAAEAVEPLAQVAGDTAQDRDVRVAAIQALAALGPRAAKALPTLLALRRDAAVFDVVVYALEKIRGTD